MLKRRVLHGILLVAIVALFLVPVTLAQAQAGTGKATVRDSQTVDDVKISDRITIEMTDVPALPANQAYEGWLVSDDGSVKLSLGVIAVSGGKINHTFTSSKGENLFSKYDKVVITVEPVPDADPNPTTTQAFHGVRPGPAMTHIRHLLYSFAANPAYTAGNHAGTPKGLMVGLRDQTRLAYLHANLALNSSTLADVKLHAEHVINMISGGAGTDANGDGTISDPGDTGPGVLGYAATGRQHAGFTLAAAPTDDAVKTNAPLAADSADGAADRATTARTEATSAIGATTIDVAKLFMDNVRTNLDRALNGWDRNNDGVIASNKDEGGVAQAYLAAQNMGTYTLKAGPVPPSTGDISYTHIALGVLLGGAFLLLIGGLIYRRSRLVISR